MRGRCLDMSDKVTRYRSAEHNRKISVSNLKDNLSEESIANKVKGCSERSKDPKYLHKLSVANRGENAKNHKVTEEDVREIKRLWETKAYSTTAISDMYPISRQSVNDIVSGRTWKHVK